MSTPALHADAPPPVHLLDLTRRIPMTACGMRVAVFYRHSLRAMVYPEGRIVGCSDSPADVRGCRDCGGWR